MSEGVYLCVHASKFLFTWQVFMEVGMNIIPLQDIGTGVI